MIANLTEAELAEAMLGLPPWRLAGERLVREWQFPGFPEAIQFVNQVALAAQAEDHHPDIYIRFNRVTLELWTHVTNGITRRDIRLAERLS